MIDKVANNLSVVIVNYRTPELTVKCVDSILRWGVAEAKDIVVVENSSPDNSAQRLKSELPSEVSLVVAERNNGYSAGVNIGAMRAKRDFILVLNPDTYFVDQSIDSALVILKNDTNVGLIGLDLIYPNNERQYSARRFYSFLDIVARRTPLGRYWPFKSRVAKHMMVDQWGPGTPFDTDWVMGTGFVVRRQLFEQLGGMDEDYFLYMEDVDFCARIWKSGSRVICVPGARLIHDHQRSSAAGVFSMAGRLHLKSLSTYMKRHQIPIW